SAVTIGYAALTRPTYQVLALAVVGYLLLVRVLLPWAAVKWRDLIKASLILTSVSIVMVGGYAFFNYRNFSYFVVTPKLGLSLSIKIVRFSDRLPDDYAEIRDILIRARNADLVREDDVGYMYIGGAVPELKKKTGFEPPQLSDYMLKLNLMLIQKAPLNYLR